MRPGPFKFTALAALLGSCNAAQPPAALSPVQAPVQAPVAAWARPEHMYPVDFVLIDKSERRLILFANGKAVKAYGGLQFGDAPQGHKQFQGDERTPEGRYFLDYRNPQSSYHLSLHISYPNAADAAYAQARGRSPGGAIFIHGQPNGLSAGRMSGDWTDGCVALTNAQIEEIWSVVADGTPIEIRS